MPVAAMTFWTLVCVFTAWGVHQIVGGMVKSRILNTALLPGTLVAQVGHVLGLLITGATIRDTTLYDHDDEGAPQTTPRPKPRIPVIGPIVIGLLPLVTCTAAIVVVARLLGGDVLHRLARTPIRPSLPTTSAGVWQLLHDQITLAESMATAIAAANLTDWKTWVFLYLLTCLTIQISPFRGTLRSALGAIVVLGVGAGLVSGLLNWSVPRMPTAWAVLTMTVATLTLLLLVSLAVRGAFGLVKILRNET